MWIFYPQVARLEVDILDKLDASLSRFFSLTTERRRHAIFLLSFGRDRWFTKSPYIETRFARSDARAVRPYK